MPLPGQVNNPTGSNGYGDNGNEEPYGAIERRKVLTSMAPPAGGQVAAAAINAPKRSQKKAVKGKPMPNDIQATQQQQEAPSAPMQLPPLVAFWQSLAAEPGASPLVKQYASEVGGGTASS